MSELLKTRIAESIINKALAQGADFCDIFIEKKQQLTFKQSSNKLDAINTGIDFGLGIRLIYGTEVYYGTASSLEEAELLKIVNSLKPSQDRLIDKSSALNLKHIDLSLNSSLLKSEAWEEKISSLSKIDDYIRSLSEKISELNLNLIQNEQEIQIYNSHGLNISDSRNYIRLSMTAIAEDGSLREDAYEAPGATMLIYFIINLNY